MDLEKLDVWLSVIDLIVCVSDIVLICYLFFYKFPQEIKKKFKFSKILKRTRFRHLRKIQIVCDVFQPYRHPSDSSRSQATDYI